MRYRCYCCHHPEARHKYGNSIDYDCIGDCDICNASAPWYRLSWAILKFLGVLLAGSVLSLSAVSIGIAVHDMFYDLWLGMR